MPRQLTESEFKATVNRKMHDVTESATVWPYVESVPDADLEGHSVYEHFVEAVYRSDDGCYDHVLVMTRTKNVYLTVIVDLPGHSIHGHRLLDLNREYGMS